MVALMPLTLSFPKVNALSREPVFHARVEFIVSYVETGEVTFSMDEVKEIDAPLEPRGYSLYYMEIRFPEGMSKSIVPIEYDRVAEDEGRVLSLFSYSGKVKLVSNKENITVPVAVETFYIKRTWMELKEGELEIKVEDPGDPFTPENMTLRIVIDNFAPYGFVGLIGPEGEDLVNIANQELLGAEAIKVDFKHVEVRVGEVGLGTYKAVVAKGDDYVLPNAFIVGEEGFLNKTIKPFSTHSFTIKQKPGWRAIGAIVILYSVTPYTGNEAGSVTVDAQMLDYAYEENGTFRVESASFLVPPLKMKFWIKSYIVYGGWFKVVNTMSMPVNVIYVPISIKEVGRWTERGLVVEVSEDLVKDSAYAYLVVQVPPYGRIVALTIPGGERYDNYREALKYWFNSFRSIGMLENEAYIQVKSGDVMEAGTYVFQIEWEPIKIIALDNSGAPLANALVSVTGPLNVTATTDEEGRAEVVLYSPGVYTIEVGFKGVTVAGISLGTVTDTNLRIKCAVYNLTIIAVGARDQKLIGTQMTVKSLEGTFISTSETDGDGITKFVQLPRGKYLIEAAYKRVSSREVVELNDDMTTTIKLDVLIELPLLGIPLTTAETLASAVSIGAAALFARAHRMKGRRDLEEEAEEVEVEID